MRILWENTNKSKTALSYNIGSSIRHVLYKVALYGDENRKQHCCVGLEMLLTYPLNLSRT